MVANVVTLSAPAQATAGSINNQINFQGRLLNAAGAVVADGNYNMQFKIYKDGDGAVAGDTGGVGGTLLWTEAWLGVNSQAVTVKNGYFSVNLGSVNPLTGVDFNQSVLWLSQNVAGGANATSNLCGTFAACNSSSDPELLPMRRLASAVYALQANSCTTCILQAPTSTAQNTISPVTSGVTALTVNGTNTGTAATALSVVQTGAATALTVSQSANAANLAVTNTGATNSNLLTVTQSTSAYTGTAILVNLAAGSGSFASGNFLDLQANSASKFKVDFSGVVTAATSLQAPLVDTASAVALNIGTNNATAINLNKPTTINTSVVASATASMLQVGATALVSGNSSGTYIGTNATTGYAGDFLNYQLNGVSQFYVSASGSLQIFNTNTNTQALKVGSNANATLLNADTVSNFVVNNGTYAPRNLLQNPGFETNAAASAGGWVLNSSAYVVDNTNAHTGNKELQITPTGAIVNTYPAAYAQAAPGDQFYGEAWVKSSGTTNGTASLFFQYYDKDKASLGFSAGTTIPSAVTTYTLYKTLGTAPANTVYVKMGIGPVATSTTGLWYVDDEFFSRQTDQTPMIFQNSANSTTAFQIQNAAATPLLTVDTSGTNFTVAAALGVTGTTTINTTGTAATSIGNGTGLLTLQSGATATWSVGGTNQNLTVQTSGTGTLTLNTVGAGTVALGDTNSTTINIGGTSGATTTIAGGAVAHTVVIANGAAAQSVTVGSTNTTSATTIQGGTGNITLTSTASTVVKPSTDTAAAFQIQNAAGTNQINVNSLTTTNNLWPNPSFEQNIDGVALHGAATSVTHDGTGVTAQFGANTLKLVAPATANTGASFMFPFKGSTTYNISMWMRRDAGSASNINIGRADNGTDTDCATNLTITTTWTQFTCTSSFTTGTTIGNTSNFYVKVNSASASTIYIDGVTLVAASTALTYSLPGSALQVEPYANQVVFNAGNNPEIQPWQLNSVQLSLARARASVVSANGYVYVIGGGTGVDGATPATTVYYAKQNADGSLGSGTWGSTTAIGTAVSGAGATVVNGYIYLVGGNTGSRTALVQYARLNADGTVGTWGTTTSLPAARDIPGVTSYNGVIQVVGGSTGGTESSTLYGRVNQDGTISSWTSGTSMNTSREELQTVVSNGYIYAVGGTNIGVTQSSSEYAQLNADGSMGTWITSSSMPAARSGGGVVAMNGNMYVIGGWSTGTTVNANVYSAPILASGALGTWISSANPLPIVNATTAQAGIECVSGLVLNGYLYLIGGDNNSVAQKTIYYTSGARIKINGSLDLTSASGTSADPGSSGTLTAGNTNIVGTLQAAGAASFLNNVTLLSGLTVGGNAVFKTSTNSVTAFQVKNSGNTTVFNIDTSVGAITTGVWNGTAVGAQYGGTGQSSYAVGDLLYASTTTALSKLADVSAGQCLVSGGIGVAPSWSGCSGFGDIRQVPASTAANTIAPTAASVVALSVKGTTGTAAHVLDIYDSTATPALQAYVDATGSLNVSKLIQPTATNTLDVGLTGTQFRTGYFGTSVITPLLDTNSAVALNIGTTNASSINIGKSASNITTTVNGLFVAKPTSGNDSATAFQVQNAAGTALLVANTASGYVQTGSGAITTTPSYFFTSDISNNAAGNAQVAGDWHGSNTWGIGANSNAADNVLRIGITSGATWQTNNNMNLLVAGTELVKPTTGNNSLTTLQVQNASATTVFDVDTTNARVGIGTAAPGASLDISSGTIMGAGLSADCSTQSSKLLWSSSTKQFSCGTDRASLSIRKSADTNVTSSTTLVNISDFTFSIGASETWAFQINDTGKAGTSGNYDYAVTAPSGATCDLTGVTLTTADSNTSSTCGGRVELFAFASGVEEGHISYGIVSTGATSGTVNFQMSQHASNATTTTMFGNSVLMAYKLTGADLAEIYYTNDPTIQAGDVVAIDPSAPARVRKPTSIYDPGILGVISTKPGQILADDSAPSGRPVMLALAGRIPVKVTTENGPIAPGDLLTSSSTPGVAMKATRPGQIIGKALAGYSNPDHSAVGFVMTFAGQSYNNAGEANSMQGGTIGADVLGAKVANIGDLNVSGTAMLAKLSVMGAADIRGDLTVGGTTYLVDLEVGGHIITGGATPTVAAGSAACSEPEVAVSGTDTAGTITVATGEKNCTAPGSLASVLFAKQYTSVPKVILTPVGTEAPKLQYGVGATTVSGFDLETQTPAAPGKTYTYNYFVIQ